MTKKTETRLQERKDIELYPLPDSWHWVTVNDVAAPMKHAIVDGPFGSNLKVSDYVENGPVPVLTTKNLGGNYDDVRYITQEKFEKLKRSAVYGGDILVAKIGSCGKTGIYPFNMPPAMIPANLLKVTLNESFYLKYVYYYFNSSFFQEALKTIIKATAQPALGVTNFRKLPLPCAPPNEQKRIVAEIEKQFSRLDEAVTSLKRAKVSLKRYKAAVLRAAVEGKLTEQWRKENPDVEPAEKLLERILAERRTKWEEAELAKVKSKGIEAKDDFWKKKYKEPAGPDINNLPELPKGWIWVATDQMAWYVTSGSRDWKKYYSDRGALFIRTQDINKNRLDLNDLAYVELPDKAEGKRSLVEIYDLLVVITGANVGKVALIENSLPEAYVSQSVGLMKLPSKNIAKYLHLAMIAEGAGKTQLDNMAYGMGRPVLNLDNLRDIRIPLPPYSEQLQIILELDRRFSVANKIEESIEACMNRAEGLRQSILKKAFLGKLVTPDSH
jgi:type I restriction enzyme S subunit